MSAVLLRKALFVLPFIFLDISFNILAKLHCHSEPIRCPMDAIKITTLMQKMRQTHESYLHAKSVFA